MVRLAVALLVALNTAKPSFADKCLSYEPAQVKISGKLTMGQGYGPPNFGEDPAHDEFEIYGLITLDRATCVSAGKGGQDEYVERINTFQLVPANGQKLDRHLAGHRIVVTGTLFHRISGGHTDVLILYSAINKAP